MFLFSLFWFISAVLGALGLLTYFIPFIITSLLPAQDLKRKYNAEWALVTGGSSGIGKAICWRLGKQKINVVIAALPDKLLEETCKEFKKEFPDLQIRTIEVNMGKEGYLEAIAEATKDIPISLVFNNAGYIVTGFFANLPIDRIMANYECNATAAIRITHHFANRMIDEKRKGFIGFTSSPAGKIPNPSSSMYGSTKAFLTEFAASIAPELRAEGIDVLAVHPSPIASNFYAKTHDMGAIRMFKATAATPDTIARCLFTSAGRWIVHDQGYFPAVQKILLMALDFNLFAWIISVTSASTADFIKLQAERKKTK